MFVLAKTEEAACNYLLDDPILLVLLVIDMVFLKFAALLAADYVVRREVGIDILSR